MAAEPGEGRRFAPPGGQRLLGRRDSAALWAAGANGGSTGTLSGRRSLGGLPLFPPLERPLYVHYADPPEHVVLNDSCTVVDRTRDAGCAAMRGVGA